MKLRAVIIEDEEVSREILTNYLGNYCPDVEILGQAENIQLGEKLIREKQPELVFLDIEMPFGNGFDLLEKFTNINFEVIFITAFSDYAVKAINLSASSYLLKPIDIDEFTSAVNKVKHNLEAQQEVFNTKILAENIKSINKKDQKMVIPQMDGFEVVQIADIIRAEAADNYTILFLNQNRKYTLSKTLKFYEELLSEYGFLRTHKSHLVNADHILKYKKGKTGELTMSDNSTALVSANAKKELVKFFR
ncbi:MAG: LytR/AlgR family response regulator transcription factor [Putridiphycobacter sp.]